MRSPRVFRSTVILLIAGAVATAGAQELVPVGEPVEIRPVKTDGNWSMDPRVAVSPGDGSFVVTWFESLAQPVKIPARRFGPAGQPLDPVPIQVNSTTSGFQAYQTVAASRSGEFLVVWAGSPSDPYDPWDVFGQRFDRDGNRLGGQATFNQDPSGAELPSIAMAPSGEFAVGWERYWAYDIGFRRLDASGAPLQPEAQANIYTTGNQLYASVAIDPVDGTSLVAWVSNGQQSPPQEGCTPPASGRLWRNDVIARRFDAQGRPVGGEILLSTPRPWGLRSQRPAVAPLGGGRFFVAWLDTRPVQCWPDAPQAVRGRVVEANGLPGDDLTLSDMSALVKTFPLLAPDPGRGFLALWREASRGHVVRRFDLEGMPFGSDTVVLPPLTSPWYVNGVALATDGAGNPVVVWDQVLDESTPERPENYTHQLFAQLWGRPETPTPTGDSVTARPVDPVSGTMPVQLTFSTVTAPGTTTVTSSSQQPAPLPLGFSLGDPPVHYDVSTTAELQGPIEVCFSYAGITFQEGQMPCIFHGENGSFVPLASWSDPVRQVVCAQTPSLSPFTLASLPVSTVGIDVKPGSQPNSINLGAAGNTPVAVLGAAGFDARTVDGLSLTFAGVPALRLPNGKPMVETRDVNRDGRADLLAYFATRALKLGPNDTTATLEGRTRDGKLIRGTDAVRILR